MLLIKIKQIKKNTNNPWKNVIFLFENFPEVIIIHKLTTCILEITMINIIFANVFHNSESKHTKKGLNE